VHVHTYALTHVNAVAAADLGRRAPKWAMSTSSRGQAAVADVQRVREGLVAAVCRPKSVQKGDALIKWATILAALAVRVERLKQRPQEEPDILASEELSPRDIRVRILLKREQKDLTEVVPDSVPCWLAPSAGSPGSEVTRASPHAGPQAPSP